MLKKIAKVISTLFLIFFIYFFVFGFSFCFDKADNLIRKTRNSQDFTVYPKNVIIEGNEKLSRDEILILAGLDKKKSYFDVSEKKLEVYLYANRLIKKCMVQKIFPNTVKILIEEYKPAMIVNSIERRSGSKELYSLWFADKEGLVFKKVLPHEARVNLPFFYIDMKITEGTDKTEKIKKAVEILDEWKKVSDLCSVSRIYYDTINNYVIDCEFKNKNFSKIYLGTLDKPDEIREKRENFFATVKMLEKKNMRAGEFFYDEKSPGNTVIVGNLAQNR